MKLLGSSDDNRVSQVQTRAQDDAAVGYGFQRPPDFSHYDKDGSRWASGDDGIIEVIFPLFVVSCVQLIQFHNFIYLSNQTESRQMEVQSTDKYEQLEFVAATRWRSSESPWHDARGSGNDSSHK